MAHKNYIRIAAALTMAVTLFFSCKKNNYDMPPVNTIPVGSTITISEIKSLFRAQGYNHKFTGDTSLFATVTADEQGGSLYKEVYLRDANGDAIHMKLLSSGGLYFGDSVRINLKGTVIDAPNLSIQIDSVNVNTSIIKLKTGLNPIPRVVSLNQIDSSLDGQLVKINNIHFSPSDTGLTYYVPNSLGSNTASNAFISYADCQTDGDRLVYNSKFSGFANQKIPPKSGSLTVIVQLYGSTSSFINELIIPNYGCIQLNQPYCTTGTDIVDTLSENFNSSSYPSGSSVFDPWQIYIENSSALGSTVLVKAITGTATPSAISHGNYPQFSSYTSQVPLSYQACTGWLISPPVSYGTAKKLTFDAAWAYYSSSDTTFKFSILVSSDYDGIPSHAPTSTWHDITSNFGLLPSPTNQTQSNTFFTAGSYIIGNAFLPNIPSYYYVAFRYHDRIYSSAASYFIDNITIK